MRHYFKNVVAEGDRPSASEHNKIVNMLMEIIRSLHIEGILDSTGFHTRTVMPKTTVESCPGLKVFRIFEEGTGDGIYNCYEQTLDATEWADTAGDNKFDGKDAVSVEVLNLAEFDPEATYVAHLAADDLILAWQKLDDEGSNRWIGVPFRQANADRTRIAYCKDDAGEDDTIDCYLDQDDDGTVISVTCSITGGSALDESIPRLAIGDMIFVTKIGATWYCTGTIFTTTEECVCEAPT